jgi:UDP-2-acetamido-2-deoxy-ribo-hexuluronate aminotransferase
MDYLRIIPENLEVKAEIMAQISDFIDSGEYISGKAVKEFEQAFAEYCKVKYAIGVNSGTDALFLSLKALGIGQGDEVITTSLTFPATLMAILNSGATPVMIDINDTLNMDPEQIEPNITEKTRAVMPVHYTGKMTDMKKISQIAKKNNLFMIEDSAQACGAFINNKPAGSWGDTGCFSFFPTKNLSTLGDGGIITTNNKTLWKKLNLLKNFGRTDRETFKIAGFNTRLDTIHAIILKEKLKHVDRWNNKRIEIARYYQKHLSGIMRFARTSEHEKEVYHFCIGCLKKGNNFDLLTHAEKNGIDLRIHYQRLVHQQPFIKDKKHRIGSLKFSKKAAGNMVSLPCFPSLRKEEQDKIIQVVKAGSLNG